MKHNINFITVKDTDNRKGKKKRYNLWENIDNIYTKNELEYRIYKGLL